MNTTSMDGHRPEMLIVRIKQKGARLFIQKYHRHLPKPPVGWKFGGGAFDTEDINECTFDRLIGVIWIGSPVSRHLDDGSILEINRLCTLPNIPNLNSKLIGWAIKECKKKYKDVKGLVTYLRRYELATVMKATNFFFTGYTGTGKWRGNNFQTPKQRWYYPFCKKRRTKILEKKSE